MLSGTRIVRRAIRRGDSADAVMRAYPGRITVMPSKCVTHGHDLVYKPASARLVRYRFIFQTDGQVVDAILAGRLPEINLVEGCGSLRQRPLGTRSVRRLIAISRRHGPLDGD